LKSVASRSTSLHHENFSQMNALNIGSKRRLIRLERDVIEHEPFVNALSLDDWHFEPGEGFFDAGIDPVEGIQHAAFENLESPLILVDKSKRTIPANIHRQYAGLRQQDNEESDDTEDNIDLRCGTNVPSIVIEQSSSYEKDYSFKSIHSTTSVTASSPEDLEDDTEDDHHIEETSNLRDLRRRPTQAIGSCDMNVSPHYIPGFMKKIFTIRCTNGICIYKHQATNSEFQHDERKQAIDTKQQSRWQSIKEAFHKIASRNMFFILCNNQSNFNNSLFPPQKS